MAYLMRPAYNICKEFRTPSPGKVAGRSQRLLQCSAQRQGGERPPPPSNPSYSVTRRAITLQSFGLAFIGTEAFDNDSRTVINSVLGAYGLPQMAAAKGLRPFDDFDLEYAFSYPKSWVRRRNSLREGIYISDFNTADKLSVETFPVEGSDGNGVASEAFALRVVGTLLNPGAQAGGDSRIELPPTSRIKSEVREIDGKVRNWCRKCV